MGLTAQELVRNTLIEPNYGGDGNDATSPARPKAPVRTTNSTAQRSSERDWGLPFV